MANAEQRKCNGTNRHGEPCGARAMTPEGKCAMHGGLVDPSAMGKAGGRASARIRNGFGPEVADDDLRELARSSLRDALKSDDEKTRLAAARSLFSYGTTTPPGDGAGPHPAAASVQHDWKAIADALEAAGVIRRGPAITGEADAESHLYAEIAQLKRRIRELERELEKERAEA
jgi:hypothetical protein